MQCLTKGVCILGKTHGYVYDHETGLYYLQSRYYSPEQGRFLNADAYASTGHGLLGNNMFAYCNNSPVFFLDRDGCEPEEAVDTDGDGIIDYYVYSYTYTTGILFWTETHVGYVYIYVGKSMTFFDTPANYPENFHSESDLLIGDYTSSSNPNMYAYHADQVRKENRSQIIDIMLTYDNDMNTPWDRTKESLMIEWKEHHRYALFSESARNIDFDNNEEGKNAAYYFKKAVSRLFEQVTGE